MFPTPWTPSIPLVTISSENSYRIGKVTLKLGEENLNKQDLDGHLFLLASQCSLLEKLSACVVANWLALIVGPPNTGKRSTVEILAKISGNVLHRMKITAETDAQELLGSFEQEVKLPF